MKITNENISELVVVGGLVIALLMSIALENKDVALATGSALGGYLGSGIKGRNLNDIQNISHKT